MKDLNLRRQSRGIYSPLPLAARATHLVDLANKTERKGTPELGYLVILEIARSVWCMESVGVVKQTLVVCRFSTVPRRFLYLLGTFRNAH